MEPLEIKATTKNSCGGIIEMLEPKVLSVHSILRSIDIPGS